MGAIRNSQLSLAVWISSLKISFKCKRSRLSVLGFIFFSKFLCKPIIDNGINLRRACILICECSRLINSISVGKTLRKLPLILIPIWKNIKTFGKFSFVEISACQVLLSDVIKSTRTIYDRSANEFALCLTDVSDLIFPWSFWALDSASNDFSILKSSFVLYILLINKFTLLSIKLRFFIQGAFIFQSIFQIY